MPLLGSPRTVVVYPVGEPFVDVLADQDVRRLRPGVYQGRQLLPALGNGLQLLFGQFAHGYRLSPPPYQNGRRQGQGASNKKGTPTVSTLARPTSPPAEL